MFSAKSIAALTLGILVFTACGSTPAPAAPPEQTHPGGAQPGSEAPQPIVRPATRVIDAASRQALTGLKTLEETPLPVYELRYAAATDLLRGLQPGNVLVSEPGPHAPYGYLVKVRSVRQEGDELVITAEQARLTDALEQGRLEVEQRLRPDQLEAAEPLAQGVRLTAHSLIDTGDSYDYTVSLDRVLHDVDGNEQTTADQVASKGQIHFNMGYSLYLDIGLFDVDFRAKVHLKEKANVRLDMHGQYAFEKSHELYKTSFKPVTFFIGPVPVVIVPKMKLSLDASGKVQGEMTYELAQSFDASVGAEYIDDWKNLSSGPNWTFKPGTFSGQGSAEVQAGPAVRGDLMLYGVAGVYGKVGAYARFKAQYPGKPLWQLDLCTAGEAGVALDLFVTELKYGGKIFQGCKKVAEAANTPPVVKSITVERDGIIFGGNPNAPFSTQDFLRICAKAEDAEDAALQLSFASDKEALNGTVSNDGCIVHRFTTTGSRTLTVTAQDSGGLKGSKSMSLSIGEADLPVPTVQISAPSSNQTVYAQGNTATVSLLGSSSLEDCTREKWSSSNPADLLPGNNCGNPQVTFAGMGSRTLTLTATNAQNEQGSASVSVNVQPKPAENQQAQATLDLLGQPTQIYRGDPATARWTVTDPENDAVSYVLKLYRKGEPGSAQVVDQGSMGGSGVGQKTFVPSDYFSACVSTDFVLQLEVTDGKHADPHVRTYSFSQPKCPG
ncbi:hypothetical protein HNR42_001500 [Deinobacterium chartae]|uniref:PKD domain-containing protein n=1 Tax=Deinobacterium chartae TaxID=521158 RepID=A0A841I2C6_9DEIO|nr:hypothetical protein [Deinobacterium chartae]MBB6098075.1 hypothetical protein [Deinobacterium chartae]